MRSRVASALLRTARSRPSALAASAGLAFSFSRRASLAGAGPAASLATVASTGKPTAAAASALAPALSDKYEYDVVVIGGGSGGLACAREVAALKGKVALLDYVTPSPAGTKWGLGGTCVNVGCIPKKLMHQAGLLGASLHDAREYGWELPPPETIQHNWSLLASNVQSYIKGTNWGYRNALRDERVEYVNALGRVVDPHTVEYTDKAGKAHRLSAAHIVVAVGGRPRYPDNVEGAKEYGITSDDLFWRADSPGKTLLVGAGYVALECAGFLTEIGCDATVMARGAVLRGFDQDIAQKIVDHMTATGTRMLRGAAPTKLEPLEEADPANPGSTKQRVRVHYTATPADGGAPTTHTEVYDTVVFATGRGAVTAGVGLDRVGVAMEASGKVLGDRGRAASAAAAKAGAAAAYKASESNGNGNGSAAVAGGGKIETDRTSAALQALEARKSVWAETTNIHSIHALGDVLAGRPELTPVAIRAGKLLAKRIFAGVIPTEGADPSAAPLAATVTEGGSVEDLCMDYGAVPTTVFTPLEYGCVGYSESEAVAQYGADGIDVWHLAYDTLELNVAHRVAKDGSPLPPQCYAKLITTRDAKQRVLGLHVLGPNAGDVIQGFAVAIKMGATKADFDSTVGIHPTHAEEVVQLDRNKRDGGSAVKTSC